MKNAIAMLAAAVMLSAVTSAADSFSGVITDTMCGAKPHSLMMKNMTDAECVKLCAKGPHEYALLAGNKVLKLSDQKAASHFPAEKVKVAGIYNEKTNTIKVASIEPLADQ